MKKIYSIILFTLLIIMSSISVLGLDYTQRGYSDKNYLNDERGIFNTGLTETQLYVRNLNDNLVQQPPLIYDFVGDGTKNIITTDGKDFIFLKGKELTPNGSLSVSENIKEYSIFNYNSKNYLVYSSDEAKHQNISVYEFNSSKQWEFIGTHQGDQANNEIAFNCDENTGYCASLHYGQDSVIAFTFKIDSSVNYISKQLIFQKVNANYILCYPSIPDLSIYNPENDDFIEFYASASEQHITIGNSLAVSVLKFVLNSTGEVSSEEELIIESNSFAVATNCADNKGLYTSPLIMDVDLVSPNDIVIGMGVDVDEYKMYAYKLNGVDIDDYPELFNADGVIISNPIQGKFFDHNYGAKDFCVLGYIDSTDSVDLLCASEQIGEIFGLGNSEEFNSPAGSSTFDISIATEKQNIIHASQHSTELTGSTDLNEVITPFGIARLTSSDELEYIFQPTLIDSIIIDNDYEDVGLSDLIVQSQTGIVYIDDLFTNQPADIDGYIINPCIDQVWKTNTSVGITITPTDPELDQVRAKAILYYNDPDGNEQETAFSNYVNSGTPVQFVLKANKSISSATLKMIVNDIENNGTTTSLSLNFAVASDGVSFGDCLTTVTDIVEDEEVDVGIGSGDVGSPCEDGSDCNSGNCEYKFCRLKGSLVSCASDSQCLSGECVDGQCTKPNLKENLDQSKEELFGADDIESSSILVVLALTTISILIIIATRNVFGVILAVLVFIVGAFVFTFLGWLSPFVLIGVVLFILIAFVFMMILGKGGGN